MTISIPKPFSENRAQMRPDEKDRFCSRCAHSVRDFSHRTFMEDLIISNEGNRNEKRQLTFWLKAIT